MFDRDALIEGLRDHIEQEKTFHRVGDQLNMQPLRIDEWDAKMTDMALNGVSGAVSKSAEDVTRNAVKSTMPDYADEIPPFDITISFANEYGQKATVVLYSVELLNETSGFSIDNVTSEKACTFVARKVDYMRPVEDE